MSTEDVLRNEMIDLFESFNDLCLTPGEEVELVFSPHQRTDPVVVRYGTVRDARAIPLAYGPACELYVILTSSECEFPTPVDPTKLLASWRMRERAENEIGLSSPVGQLKFLSFGEPSLQFTNIYPANENQVCEANYFFHQSRHRGSEPATR